MRFVLQNAIVIVVFLSKYVILQQEKDGIKYFISKWQWL